MGTSRNVTTPVEDLLAAASEPIFAVGHDRRIVFFNPACERLFGCKADDVLGQECYYGGPASSDALESLRASLCPPPEAFEGQRVRGTIQVPVLGGAWHQRAATFLPCHDERGDLLWVVGYVEPDEPQWPAVPDGPQQWHDRLHRLRARLIERYGIDQIVCESRAMRRVLRQIRAAAACDAPLLITGPEGAGKELVARTIHYAGARRDEPFVPIDCAVLPPEILERTLAKLLDGAPDDRPAYVSAGSVLPGTLYLDEVLHLPRDYQAQLVPWACQQHGEFPERPARSPRLIASTSENAAQALAEGGFRDDLYYALTTLTIAVPPLRERLEDVPLLAQSFLEQQNARGEHQVGSLSDEALAVLARYDWPGNVRELAETIATAHGRATSAQIQQADLPLRIRAAQEAVPPARQDLPVSLDELLIRVEARLIRLALERARGNKSRAAEVLGISRPRLYRRMEMLGIEPGQPR
ncbi:MAG: sigma 54-interacting transcriptional regulator [Pirellulales bacterium]